MEKSEINTPPEHKTKLFEQSYHDTQIKILEIEHQDITLQPKMDIELQRPKNWQDELRQQINEGPDSVIFPEYCMPDLEQNVFRELVTGPAAREASKTLGITDFHSFISTSAGISKKTLVATDIANTNWYQLLDVFSSWKTDLEKIQRDSAPNIAGALGLHELGYELGNIKRGEYQMHTSNDARHLISARGIMEYSINEKPRSILSIWAPYHAERIADYIKRQSEWEDKSSITVEQPVDFKYVSPKEEQRKMKVYGRPPLHRTIREYKSILSPLAYEIHQDAITSFDSPKALKQKMAEYLNQTVPQVEVEHQNRIRKALQQFESHPNKVLTFINTDKYGWKLTRKDYIY